MWKDKIKTNPASQGEHIPQSSPLWQGFRHQQRGWHTGGWGVTTLQNTLNFYTLPLYFVRGLSPERATRAAATGWILRLPDPVLWGHKSQTSVERQRYLGEVIWGVPHWQFLWRLSDPGHQRMFHVWCLAALLPWSLHIFRTWQNRASSEHGFLIHQFIHEVIQ